MSISYALKMHLKNGMIEPRAISDLLCSRFVLKPSKIAGWNELSGWETEWVDVSIREEAEDNGARQRCVRVRFDLHKGQEVAEPNMLRMTFALLEHFPQAEAVLTLDDEEVVLVRSDGRLTVTDDHEFWIPQVTALYGGPFEIRGPAAE